MIATQDLPVLGLNAAVLKVVQIGALSPDSYKSSWFLPIKGPSDAATLQAALADLVDRHEALRATIDVQAGCERIHAAGTSALELVDLRGTPCNSRLAQECAEEFLVRPVDASSLPTLRCCAIRISDDEWLLALNCPTWFVDGWSICIISAELLAALEDREAPKFLDRAHTAYSATLLDDSLSAPLGEVVARTEALCSQDVRRTNGLTRRLSPLMRVRAWLIWKALVASIHPIVARVLQILAPAVGVVRRVLDRRSARAARRGDVGRAGAQATGAGRTAVRRIVGELPPGSAATLRRFAATRRCTLTSVCVAATLQTMSSALGEQGAYVLNVFGRRSPKTFGTVGSLADADWIQLDRALARSDLETIAPEVSRQIMTSRGIARSGGRIAAKTISDEQRAMIRAGFNRLFHPWELFVVIETSAGAAMEIPIAGMTLQEWAEARARSEGAPGVVDQERRRIQGSRGDVQVSPPRRAETAHFELIPLVPHLLHISFDVTEADGVRVDVHYDSDRFRDEGIAELLTACLERLGDTCRTLATENGA